MDIFFIACKLKAHKNCPLYRMNNSFLDNTDDDEITSNFSLNWEPTSDSELAKLSFTNNLLPILEQISKDSSTTEKESRQEKFQYYGR